MSFADANRASIRVIEETTWATTPTSGPTREVRLTSSSLSAGKETVISDEIRADRMVSSITEVSAMSEGDINFEHSAGAQDEFLAAFVMGAWSRPMERDFVKGRSISVATTSTVVVSGRDLTPYFASGRRIKMDGFINSANNGYFQISTVAFAGGNTTFTLTVSTLVAEAGTSNASIYDANDVIILRDTTIASDATGFDSGGNDAFAAAIAAGQLVPGQKIFVDGLTAPVATIFVDDATQDASDLVFTLTDGVNTHTFTEGVDFTAGSTGNTSASIAAAIMAKRYNSAAPLNVRVTITSAGSDDTVNIFNLNESGGALTVVTAAVAGVTLTDYSTSGAAVRGSYTIVSASDDNIVTNPVPPRVIAAGGAVTVKGSMLRNPTSVADIVQRKFTIETAFNDVGQFMVQDGMVPGTFSLEVATGAIITGTMGFQGRETLLRQTTLLSDAGSYTVQNAHAGEVMNATTNVGVIEKDGDTFGSFIQSLSISGEANLRQQAAVGSKFAKGIGAGRFNLTGSMTVYFEDENLFLDFLNHATVSLSFTITDLDGQSEIFTIPAIKFTQDQIAPGGIDQDVFDNVEFTAFRDDITGCMLQVDRFSPNRKV